MIPALSRYEDVTRSTSDHSFTSCLTITFMLIIQLSRGQMEKFNTRSGLKQFKLKWQHHRQQLRSWDTLMTVIRKLWWMSYYQCLYSKHFTRHCCSVWCPWKAAMSIIVTTFEINSTTNWETGMSFSRHFIPLWALWTCIKDVLMKAQLSTHLQLQQESGPTLFQMEPPWNH